MEISSALQPRPTVVQFIGSTPLSTSTATFKKLAGDLGAYLSHLPDGEPGERNTFSSWQKFVFLPSPFIMRGSDFDESEARADTSTPNPVCLDSTRFDTEALASYSEFLRLRGHNIIPPGIRFQVSMPTPLSLITRWVDSKWLKETEGPYEEKQAEALTHIQSKIPHSELAIQWDAPIEFIMLEPDMGRLHGLFEPWFGNEDPITHRKDVLPGIVERLIRLGERVAKDVELGYHFCYGDIGHKHIVEPKDMSVMVQVANILLEKINRQIDWIHMPVPKDQNDQAYFLPLKDLRVGRQSPKFQLSLGLVHPWDERGTMRKIEIAREMAPVPFTIATECGLGRTDEAELNEVVQLSKKILVN